MMPENDVYCDQFHLNLGTYGAALNFMLSNPSPPTPGAYPQSDRVATVRMSLEHLKVMAFLVRRNLTEYERSSTTTIAVPAQLLNSLGISSEDWDAFWNKGQGQQGSW
ncbi:MAG: hypothetical protein AAB289_11385 [Chloroflexota bacterium]